MKTFSFFLLFAALVGGGLYLTASKFETFKDLAIGRGEILPPSEWSGILVGKWKYHRKLTGANYLWVYDGEVEYYSNGQFVRYVTCKYYHGRDVVAKPLYLRIVAGGSYSGKWSVDPSAQFFQEDIEDCNVTESRLDSGYEERNINFCETTFAPKGWWKFGDVAFEKSKFELKRFDSEKVVIKGEIFSEGASVEIVFTKEE
jgi:hypothetical protein